MSNEALRWKVTREPCVVVSSAIFCRPEATLEVTPISSFGSVFLLTTYCKFQKLLWCIVILESFFFFFLLKIDLVVAQGKN